MESPNDLYDFDSSSPSTSKKPPMKRRRQEPNGDIEETATGKFYFTLFELILFLDYFSIMNRQFVDLAESMRGLMLEADELAKTAPESLATLRSSIADFELVLPELKRSLELAEQRAKLDLNHVSLFEIGIV